VPPPPIQLAVVGVSVIAARGVVVRLACDADPSAEPPFVMEVSASQRGRFVGPILGFEAARTIRHLPFFGRTLQGTFPFDQIPVEGLPFHPGAEIQVVRRRPSILPNQGDYAVWVPLTAPVNIGISVVAPDGARVSVTATA
jgi:hypothetical protein